MQFNVWLLVVDFFILMWIGSCCAESPYIEIGATVTIVDFAWFIVLVPVVRII
jgi:ubiquinol-cytochrome c reductase cytochrome b subunit